MRDHSNKTKQHILLLVVCLLIFIVGVTIFFFSRSRSPSPSSRATGEEPLNAGLPASYTLAKAKEDMIGIYKGWYPDTKLENINDISSIYNIDPQDILAVATQSLFRPDARGNDGTTGLMQLSSANALQGLTEILKSLPDTKNGQQLFLSITGSDATPDWNIISQPRNSSNYDKSNYDKTVAGLAKKYLNLTNPAQSIIVGSYLLQKYMQEFVRYPRDDQLSFALAAYKNYDLFTAGMNYFLNKNNSLPDSWNSFSDTLSDLVGHNLNEDIFGVGVNLAVSQDAVDNLKDYITKVSRWINGDVKVLGYNPMIELISKGGFPKGLVPGVFVVYDSNSPEDSLKKMLDEYGSNITYYQQTPNLPANMKQLFNKSADMKQLFNKWIEQNIEKIGQKERDEFFNIVNKFKSIATTKPAAPSWSNYTKHPWRDMKFASPYVWWTQFDLKNDSRKGVGDVGPEYLNTLVSDVRAGAIRITDNNIPNRYYDVKTMVTEAHKKGLYVTYVINPWGVYSKEQLRDWFINAPKEAVPDAFVSGNELKGFGSEINDYPKEIKKIQDVADEARKKGRKVQVVISSVLGGIEDDRAALKTFYSNMLKEGVRMGGDDGAVVDMHTWVFTEVPGPFGYITEDYIIDRINLLKEIGVFDPRIMISELWFGYGPEYPPEQRYIVGLSLERGMDYLLSIKGVERILAYPHTGWNYGSDLPTAAFIEAQKQKI